MSLTYIKKYLKIIFKTFMYYFEIKKRSKFDELINIKGIGRKTLSEIKFNYKDISELKDSIINNNCILKKSITDILYFELIVKPCCEYNLTYYNNNIYGPN